MAPRPRALNQTVIQAHLREFRRADAQATKLEDQLALARKARAAAVQGLWDAGLTITQIANEIGVARSRVHQLINYSEPAAQRS